MPTAIFRPLPYPFDQYFSISNDCDGVDEVNFARIGHQIRRVHGLPIRDSFFASWLNQRYIEPSGPIRDKDPAAFSEDNAVFINAFHRGGFDTHHGFLVNSTMWLADGIELSSSDGQTAEARRSFHIPGGWHALRRPRYLSFSIQQQPAAEAEIELRSPGRPPIPIPSPALVEAGVKQIEVDLDQFGMQEREAYAQAELLVRFRSEAKAVLRIENVCLISHNRGDIERFAANLEEYNLHAPVFTSHGIGLVIGAKAPSMTLADGRLLADNPQSPFFSSDILDASGCRFFNSFNNTSQTETLTTNRLIVADAGYQGRRFRDFHRFMRRLEHDEITPHANPSLEDVAGSHVERFLNASNVTPFEGGLLYTHLYVRNSSDEGVGPVKNETLSATTTASLRDLSGSFYGLGRKPSRTWVAPVSVMLTHGMVSAELPRFGLYDRDRDIIQIHAWRDEFSGSAVPDQQCGYRELRYVDFAVANARTASIEVDGQPVSPLVRYTPAGRAAPPIVRVADVSQGVSIVGRARLPLEADGRYDLVADLHAFRVPGGDAAFDIGCSAGALSEHDTILCEYAVDGLSAVALEFINAGGVTVSLPMPCEPMDAEGFEPSSPDADGFVLLAVPIHEVLSRVGSVEVLEGIGEIATVRLRMGSSGPDGLLKVRRIALFRDWDGKRTSHCVVGGRVDRQSVRAVHVKFEGQSLAAKLSASGYFHVPAIVPRGVLVAIEAERLDGTLVYPRAGRQIEVLGDWTGFDIDT